MGYILLSGYYNSQGINICTTISSLKKAFVATYANPYSTLLEKLTVY
jgi:hypothetical protein